jgi:hypothetical protein
VSLSVLGFLALTMCGATSIGQETSTLIRLMEVSYSPTEAPCLIARFVPVCNKQGANGNKLQLHLILSVSSETAKQLNYDGNRDFSQWIIVSVDARK